MTENYILSVTPYTSSWPWPWQWSRNFVPFRTKKRTSKALWHEWPISLLRKFSPLRFSAIYCTYPLIFGFFVFSFHFSSQHYTNNQTKKKKSNYVLFFFSSLYIRYNNNNNTIASILKSSILSLSLSLTHTQNTEMLLSQLQSSQAWILPPRVPRLGRVSTSNSMR